jgi:DNA-binding CsgD family transcriptional regulator
MLTSDDYQNWLACLKTQKSALPDLQAWLSHELRKFFPFEKMLIAYGSIVLDEVKVESMIAIDHDEAYLQQLAMSFNVRQRNSLGNWIRTRQPFIIRPGVASAHSSDFELAEIEQFGLRNVAGHGVINVNGMSGVYCSFSGFDERPDAWIEAALKVLTPTVNELMIRYAAANLGPSFIQKTEALTERQKTILRLVCKGLPDKTIAHVLGLSAKTIRNQLTNIYDILGVRSRTEIAAQLSSG